MKNNKLIIYVHNLGYEFQWIFSHIYLTKIFARKPRHPIYIESDGLIFRCSYFLSNYSLRNLAKERGYTNKEELDYNIKRYWFTPLTKEELSYCLVDVKIIVEYIKDEINKNGTIEEIPLTSTGYARRYCLNYITEHQNIISYQNWLRTILPKTPELFNLMNEAFAGAFVHSNRIHTGFTLENVQCFDYTSDYPGIMARKRFPMRFRKANPEKFQTYIDRGMAMLIKITFYDVKATTTHSIISDSKCVYNKAEYDNGRIINADVLTTNITDLDFDIISKFYTFSKYKIHMLYVADYDYLPKNLIMAILELYKNKTTLKDVIGKEEPYLRSKELINAVFGMSVTNPLNDEIYFDYGEWDTIPTDTSSGLSKYIKGRKIFSAYQWGVWVTAWGRWELLNTVFKIGEDVAYCDTDSIKCLGNHEDIFNSDNERIQKENEAVMKYYDIDKSYFCPKTIEGKEKPLGIWDKENPYKYFKTLGAKRYCFSYEDDYFEQKKSKLKTDYNFFITVSGISKTSGKEFLINKSIEYNVSPFDLFDYETVVDGYEFRIPAEESEKSAFSYFTEMFNETVTDYLGNTGTVSETSYVNAEPVEFSISVSDAYRKLLGSIKTTTITGGVCSNSAKQLRKASDLRCQNRS